MGVRDRTERCLIVIFGASGDLTKRKLIPALYDLDRGGYMPQRWAVLGVSRSDIGDDGLRERAKPFCEKHERFDEASWEQFASNVFYHAGDATDLGEFRKLVRRVDELSQQRQLGENLLLYLSVAPKLYDPIIMNIGATGLVTEGKRWCSLNREALPWQRIVVEKPFGHDLKSAAHLNRVLGRVFEEEATFRIDHYLGKETVQNLMVFRFANAIFEPLWRRDYIEQVQVTAVETVGVEGRGGFYEGTGAMKDMIQSHLLNVMAAVAMEPPNSMKAFDVRSEQRKVLEGVRDIAPEQVDRYAVRGQYGVGEIHGDRRVAYVDEEGVAADSNTETYAAVKLFVDNWRWQGVPFYVRTGKGLKRKLTQIVVYFKPTPHQIFAHLGAGGRRPPNRLVINVQPDEGISLRFEGKVPGQDLTLESAVMDFDYHEQFGGHISDAYAHLLLDAMLGDRALFKERHEIEAAWRIVTPISERWAAAPRAGMCEYPSGTWGPAEAEALFEGHGHWHNPEGQSTRHLKGKGRD